MPERTQQIISTAEELIRTGGYNGFSFREVGKLVGIKSASVHYHFPTKEDLAIAVAERYEANFFEALGDATRFESALDGLSHYCGVFQSAFDSSGKSCLCGILSNEAEKLPESLRETINGSVEKNIAWLKEVLGETSDEGAAKAQFIYCALEGAIGVAALKKDAASLKQVSEMLVGMFKLNLRL